MDVDICTVQGNIAAYGVTAIRVHGALICLLQALHTPCSEQDKVEFHLNSDSEDEDDDRHSENPSEESNYDLDLHSYQPIQPIKIDHGVMLVSPKFSRVQLHDLQVLTTCLSDSCK